MSAGFMCILLDCSDDCVSWCGAMGCFIWGRKYTCLCLGFLCCPCWWRFRSSQATKPFEQFFQVNWFSFWLMTKAAHLFGNWQEEHIRWWQPPAPYTIHTNHTGGFALWGMALAFCVCSLTNRISPSIFKFIHFFFPTSCGYPYSVPYVECILSVTWKRIYMHIMLKFNGHYKKIVHPCVVVVVLELFKYQHILAYWSRGS